MDCAYKKKLADLHLNAAKPKVPYADRAALSLSYNQLCHHPTKTPSDNVWARRPMAHTESAWLLAVASYLYGPWALSHLLLYDS